MRDFFKPWRRKAGCVTLVLACVFAAGWIRSLFVFDRISKEAGGDVTTITSILSTIEWLRVRHPVETNVTPYWSGPATKFDAFVDCEILWQVQLFGFGFGSAVHHSTHMEYDRWIIPYWSIVIPLNLLSAFLLLGKPYPATAKKTSELTRLEEL